MTQHSYGCYSRNCCCNAITVTQTQRHSTHTLTHARETSTIATKTVRESYCISEQESDDDNQSSKYKSVRSWECVSVCVCVGIFVLYKYIYLCLPACKCVCENVCRHYDCTFYYYGRKRNNFQVYISVERRISWRTRAIVAIVHRWVVNCCAKCFALWSDTELKHVSVDLAPKIAIVSHLRSVRRFN